MGYKPAGGVGRASGGTSVVDEQGRLRLDIALILDEFSDAHDEGMARLNTGDIEGARRAALKQRGLMERIMELVLKAETQNRS